MHRACWKIDFTLNELSFQSAPFNLSDSLYKIPFETKSTFTPVVNLNLDNKVISYVTFDSGSSGFLSIGGKKMSGSWKKEEHRDSWGYHSSGLFGSKKDSLTFQMFEFKIGNIEGFDAICKIENQKSKALLGIKFMENYDVYLDWEKNEVSLDPIKKFKQRNTSYGFGPKITTDDMLVVGNVLAGSHAQRMGVSIGDTITNIRPSHQKSGHPIEHCQLGEKMRKWKGPIILERFNKEPLILTREKIMMPLAPH
jgi:hypothetical protein